jgi:polar amino acid transport system substrate-binding protein
MKTRLLVFVFVLLGGMLAACSNATATATTAPASNTTLVATVDPSLLILKGKLLVCSDIPYPPMEFYDENGALQGSDIDLGNEIAARLGLKAEFVNSFFDTIIAALASGKCDIILSSMNIAPERNKQVSMIPYFKAGQSFVALKGNPQNINTSLDLCGKSAAAQSGTTMADYLTGENSYAGVGLNDKCLAAGKGSISVVVTTKDTDALQQLSAGKVAVYMADTPVAAYYVVQHPDEFQLVGEIVEEIVQGIPVLCAEEDCTNAPLSALGTAVKAALDSMRADGTYLNILTKWQLQDGAVME